MTLGELGCVIVVASGPDEIRQDSEVFAGDPASRQHRGQLLLPVVEHLDRGIHHGLATGARNQHPPFLCPPRGTVIRHPASHIFQWREDAEAQGGDVGSTAYAALAQDEWQFVAAALFLLPYAPPSTAVRAP